VYLTSNSYQWYYFNRIDGEVPITGATGLTFTDTTALQTSTLIFENQLVNNTSISGWQSTICSRAFIEPGTLPNVYFTVNNSISSTTPAGQVLTNIVNYALGAKMTISSSDTRGYFTVSQDSSQLLSTSTFAALGPGTYAVYLTQTAMSAGPSPLSQTLYITTI
jgi:hypothetical protein